MEIVGTEGDLRPSAMRTEISKQAIAMEMFWETSSEIS